MFNSGRIWLVVGALVGAAVIGLGYLLAAAPFFSEADAADRQRTQVEAQNREYEATLAHMKSLDDKKDELLDDYDELKASVPPTADMQGYFDWLATAAARSSVSLSIAGVADVKDYERAEDAIGTIQLDPAFVENLGVVQVKMTIGGTADQVADFLHLLQTDGRLQFINQVDIRLGTTLTTDISGQIFVIDDPELQVFDPSAPGGSEDGASGDAGDEPDAPDESESPSPSDTPTPPSDAETPTARG